MHEMSVTRSMLDIVRREMADGGIKKLKKLRIRVGELTAIEPEALRFSFDVSVKGTPLEGAHLEIEEMPLRGRCLRCSEEFRITSFENRCPKCGSTEIERISGHELDIISIEGD